SAGALRAIASSIDRSRQICDHIFRCRTARGEASFLLGRGGPMRSYAKSIALYERTKRSLAGGVSSNVRYASTPVPLFFARGAGARLYDVDGNVHIDYVLGNGPAILGHAPKSVIQAVADSLADGQVYAGQ